VLIGWNHQRRGVPSRTGGPFLKRPTTAQGWGISVIESGEYSVIPTTVGAWGQGSLRERRPGVFEIRIAIGVDPVSGRTVQRSFWYHGTQQEAEGRRSWLAAEFATYRAVRRAAPLLSVGDLLEPWLAAHHDWRPSTWSSARSSRGCPSTRLHNGGCRRFDLKSSVRRWPGGRRRAPGVSVMSCRVGSLPCPSIGARVGPVRIHHRAQSDR
jgi:hypothetical protein